MSHGLGLVSSRVSDDMVSTASMQFGTLYTISSLIYQCAMNFSFSYRQKFVSEIFVENES